MEYSILRYLFYQNRKTRLGFTWLYTGITRARERLYYLNWSDIGPNLAGQDTITFTKEIR